ncbi:acyl-CoA thioesterase [Pseudonocardia pini]|uniref:acyl-CoA thioesterase n=1 Tax=Pseudonocardia pini TaxID=2758030 RepID=UPI0015F0021A|nr:thioesterase family protein [Pseudonocardia pini]
MAPYVAQVPLRWTDQDIYHHVNHARAVTLLEEARVDLVFTASGIGSFAEGTLVVGLTVDYKRQVAYRPGTVRVDMTVRELRAASFTIDYALHEGPAAEDPVAIVASTRMAVVDLAAGRPRRLSEAEREYLSRWVPEPVS